MLTIHTLPVGQLEENTYILSAGTAEGTAGCVLVDPGAEAQRIAEKLDALGMQPELILLTHGHFDHIGAAKRLRERYHCPIAIGEGDAEMLRDPEKSLAGAGCTPDYIFEPDRLLQEGESLQAAGLSFTILETPGHTRGSVSYLCEDHLFCGDVLFSGSAGRTDLYGGDYDTLLETLRALALLPEYTEVYPGHGPSTSIGREKNQNPYLRMGAGYDDLY